MTEPGGSVPGVAGLPDPSDGVQGDAVSHVTGSTARHEPVLRVGVSLLLGEWFNSKTSPSKFYKDLMSDFPPPLYEKVQTIF